MTAMSRAVGGLGARVHLFVRPSAREGFVALFRDILECEVVERDFGLPYPILLVTFPDGSSFSVEFTELAPASAETVPITDASAFRGAWLEFRTTELDRLQAKLRAAEIPEFRHPGSAHAYFSAPGGQVFRLIDAAYHGA